MIGNDASLLAQGVRAAVVRPPGPFKLTVAVTWKCEQRCTHCRIWRRPRTDELSAGQWRRVWRQAADTLRWIDLTGGEVTSRPDFAEVAIAAVEEIPRLAMLHFPTNGQHPEAVEAVTKAVQGARPSRLVLSISLDGPRPLHDKLRGDPGAFDHAIETYRRVRALGVEVYFGMTLSAYNLDQLEATYDAIVAEIPEFSWRDLHANFLHVSGHYFQNEKVKRADPADTDRVIAEFRRRRGTPLHPTHALEQLYLSHVPAYLATGRSPVPCTSLAGNAFVDPEGRVFPCHIWDAPIARLDEHGFSLARIWATEEAKARRTDVEAERCPGCWTPCEAYPSLLAAPIRALSRSAG